MSPAPSTIAGGACIGLGIGPGAVRSVTGVVKAYCTRVGSGPFPSELADAEAARLREAGREFGVVTGRPRRCGWFDAVTARYAARVNGLDRLIVTKLDVLSGFDRIGIVTGYRHADGSPAGIEAMGEPGLQTDIEYHPGWSESVREVRQVKNLPSTARAYLDRLANVSWSTGRFGLCRAGAYGICGVRRCARFSWGADNVKPVHIETDSIPRIDRRAWKPGISTCQGGRAHEIRQSPEGDNWIV